MRDNIVVSEPIIDAEELGEIFVVKFSLRSQDTDGNIVLKKHTLEYVKLAEGNIDASDYQLKSFD